VSTYWVRSSGGSDANSGLTYALGKATLNGALAAIAGAAGHTVNIVNDGDHVMVAATSTNVTSVGSSFTSPGLIIQGTDSSGNPAMATVVSESTSSKAKYIRITNTANYTIVRGLKFDYSPFQYASPGINAPIQVDVNPKYVRIHDCECWGTDGVGSGKSIIGLDMPQMPYYASSGVSTTGSVSVYNCLWVNAWMPVAAFTSASVSCYSSVFIMDTVTTGSTFYPQLGSAGAGTPTTSHTYFDNTFVQIKHGADANNSLVHRMFGSSLTDRPHLQCYGNLFYAECSASAATPGISGFMLQGTTQTVGSGGHVGADYLITGPILSAFVAAWDASKGFTSYQLNENWRASLTWSGADVNSDSVAVQAASFAAAFKDSGVYSWVPGDYTHSLPYDLRPMVGRTFGIAGTPIGAIKDPILVPIPPEEDDPDSTVGRNYLDSYPFYKPVFKATTETMVRIKKNRVRNHIDFRHYLQDHVHDESTSRTVAIDVGGTYSCTLGGVYHATGLLLSTDHAVEAVVTHYNGTTDETFTVTVDQVLVLDQCMVTGLELTNSSADTATVQIVVFD
jgi:hypothetical protein